MELETKQETPPVRVRFGPGPDDSVPLSWAEQMLTKLHADNPSWFGKLIMAATGSGR